VPTEHYPELPRESPLLPMPPAPCELEREVVEGGVVTPFSLAALLVAPIGESLRRAQSRCYSPDMMLDRKRSSSGLNTSASGLLTGSGVGK
jgi:hypothetical protein